MLQCPHCNGNLPEPPPPPVARKPKGYRLLIAAAVAGLLLGAWLGYKVGAWRSEPGTSSVTDVVGALTGSSSLKNQFIALVKMNAEDPTGLEILEWKEPTEAGYGTLSGSARFRCKLIGHAEEINKRTGAVTVVTPVSVDDAVIQVKDGKITLVHCSKIATIWSPR